jgi:CDP-glucose 4,6-dehydratase
MIFQWGSGKWLDQSNPNTHHEATLLQLSIDKAAALLGWGPVWDFKETIYHTAQWYMANNADTPSESVYVSCLKDIENYEAAAAKKQLAWTLK